MAIDTSTAIQKDGAEALENVKETFSQSSEQIEGTVRLFDSEGNIRKIPIPSNDAADPLTWSTWKRCLVMLCLCVYGIAGFGVVQSTPLFFGALVPEYKRATRGEFHAADIAQLASYPSLGMGVGNFLFVPLSIMLGRRAVFLFNNALMISATIWAAKSANFEAHLIARVLQGLSCGISDCLLPIMVLDMTFLHRRGIWMSFYWAVAAAGSSLLLVIVPFAVAHAATPWRTNYWFWLAFSSFSFIISILCLPETMYPRAPALIEGQVIITDLYGNVRVGSAADTEGIIDTQNQDPEATPTKRSLISQLKPYKYQPNGFKRFYTTFAEMAVSLITPSIFYVLMVNTLLFSGLVALSLTYATQLESAPWHSPPETVGTAQIGAFLGALVALGLSGATTDLMSGFITRRSDGIREPEHVLPNFILPTLLGFAGMVLYGYVAGHPVNYPGAGWLGIHVAFGMYYCGFVALSAITGVFIGEVTPHYSGAALVLVCGGRNALSFAINDNFPRWLASQGIQNTYIELGGALFATTIIGGIPVYLFNKSIRRFWTRKMKFNFY